MLKGSVPVKGVSPGRAEESPEGGSCVSTAELVVEESTSETGGGTPSVVAGLVVSAAGFPGRGDEWCRWKLSSPHTCGGSLVADSPGGIHGSRSFVGCFLGAVLSLMARTCTDETGSRLVSVEDIQVVALYCDTTGNVLGKDHFDFKFR